MGTDYSSYTIDQLKTAWEQYADYVREASTSRAAEFVTLSNLLLVRLPAASSKGGGSVSLAGNLDAIERARDHATRWLEARDSAYRMGPEVTHADFSDFFAEDAAT